MKGGANVEINDEYLDEILHNRNISIELAMQNISNDQTVINNTVKDLKDFNSQILAIQAKRGEQLVSMRPAVKKAFDFMGDVIVELFSEHDALKNKMRSYDDNWLEETKAKLLKQIDNEKRANFIMSRMQKQLKNN